MGTGKENPALAGAHRADVEEPGGLLDSHQDTARVGVRQAAYVLRLYGLSFAVAVVVAEHAFSNGRRV